MFGGEGGGDPPPYQFQPPPSTAAAPSAGSSQQPLPPGSAGGMFGRGGAPGDGGFGQVAGSSAAFGQAGSGSLFGHTATADWTAGGAPPGAGGTLFGKPLESSTAMPGQQHSPINSAVSTTATATFGSVAALTQASASSALFGQPGSSGPAFGQSTAASTFGQMSASAATSFGQVVGAESAGFKSTTAVTSPVFGATTSVPPALFGHPVTSPAGTEPPQYPATRPAATAAASLADKAGSTIRSLFGAGAANAADEPPAPRSSLFGKTSGDKAGLFGKPNLASVEPVVPAAAAASRAAPSRGDAAPLFGKSASGAEASAASEARAPPAAGAVGAAPRLRSVFARPGESPTARRRRPSTTAVEASRRSLARTGLFGKPAEARPADKSTAVSGPPAGPRVQRLSSAEEMQQMTSLLCTEVPDGYNDRGILSRHFAKFGRVVKVSCNQAKNTATVHFADHAAADMARKRGMKVHPKLQPMSLFFRRAVKGAAEPTTERAAERARRPPPDDDVSAELRAMAGTSSPREPEPKLRRAMPPPEPRSRRTEPPPEPRARRTAAPAPAAAAAVSAAPAASAVNVSELRAALRQPAATAAERFRTLDARDKLQRDVMRREGPARSGPLVGTCPDMCPEKERYMREEKHQISNQYERDRERQGGFEMDHRLAVKQYSRSSADQEEPLPRELRTPAALLLTMDYLVTHVTDGDTRDTGDWFHFIWDRTRGIRKDITQQQLTDVVSVGLVEKCARFHVHCASALCELSRDMFDQKINNENLTKCLQTLKHMYHDLSLKGMQCEREAEFRGYDILLNLNQGDILREVQTYSDDVRDSREVHSALQLYLALSTNNYVRFFKLARRAGYLTSCLLQRYFNQVRTCALDVITRSFGPPKKVVEYRLCELQQILGFESEHECASVLRQHGLESEEGIVYLERAAFQPPDTAPELRRCHALIDAKLDMSVGQVINGGALPADPLASYRPHDSFDGQGLLRRSVAGQEAAADPTAATAAAAPRAVSPGAAAVERAAAAAAGQLLTEVVAEETRRHADHLLTAAAVVRQLCGHLYQTSMDTVLTEMVEDVCRSELVEAQQLQERQRRQQEQQEQQRREEEERRIRHQLELAHAKRDQELKDRLSAVLTETLVAEVCLDETADIAEQEMRTVQAKHSAVAEVHHQLWTDGADRLARQTAEQVLAECRRQRQALLQALIQIGRRVALRRLVGRWRQAAEDGRRLRAEQRRFPAGRPLHDARTTLRLMGGPRQPPHPPADAWAERSLCSLLLNERLASQPVSVAEVLSGSAAAARLCGHELWKLAVPAPAACPLTQWLLRKLSEDDCDQETTGSQQPDRVLQRGSLSCPAGGSLSLCVRQLCGRPAEAVGSAGLLLAFSGPGSAGRLLTLLGELPREPLLPLAVLAAPGGRQQALSCLQLPGRLRSGAVTTYRVFELRHEDALQSADTLVEALQWLFEQRPAVPPLRTARLRHLAQDFLGRQVTRRLYSDLHMRRNKKRVEQSAAGCVALYNAAVRHLSTVLSSGSLPGLSWPPAELLGLAAAGPQPPPEVALPPPDWNRPARLLGLQQTVAALSLPALDVDSDWSWAESCSKVLSYVARLAEQDAHGAPALYRVRSLLRERLQLLRRAAWPLDDDVSEQPLSASLPWTDIVQCCIELRTARLSEEEDVFYLPDELANFRVPDAWTESTSTARTGECLTLDESVAIAKSSLDESVAITNRSLGESVTIAKRSLDESVAITNRSLGESVAITKRALDESVTIAKRALDGEAESPSVKRRPDKSSLAHPTLDVSTGISRELNVSLDWEDRLRELVDQGAGVGSAAVVPTAAVTTPPRPPPAGRRASLDRQLQQLRQRLADDRRHADQLNQLLAAAGAELDGAAWSPDGPGRTSAGGPR